LGSPPNQSLWQLSRSGEDDGEEGDREEGDGEEGEERRARKGEGQK